MSKTKDIERAKSGLVFRDGRLVPQEPKPAPASPVRVYRMVGCLKCGDLVSLEYAREHIKKCWGVTLHPGEQVPMFAQRDREALLVWIAKRKLADSPE